MIVKETGSRKEEEEKIQGHVTNDTITTTTYLLALRTWFASSIVPRLSTPPVLHASWPKEHGNHAQCESLPCPGPGPQRSVVMYWPAGCGKTGVPHRETFTIGWPVDPSTAPCSSRTYFVHAMELSPIQAHTHTPSSLVALSPHRLATVQEILRRAHESRHGCSSRLPMYVPQPRLCVIRHLCSRLSLTRSTRLVTNASPVSASIGYALWLVSTLVRFCLLLPNTNSIISSGHASRLPSKGN